MLDKIKMFFRNLFKINNNPKCIEAPKEKVETINNVCVQKNLNFKNQMTIDNAENEKAMKLQKDFKAGLIEEEDLSEEDFDALTKLYERQIEETKNSIEQYKDSIISIKSQLTQNN